MTSGVYLCLSPALAALRRPDPWTGMTEVLAQIREDCAHPGECRQAGGCRETNKRWLREQYRRTRRA
jgi:hypothetical protein